MDAESTLQMYRIANMYYFQNLSQQEIASKENISRSQISRILKRAREIGLVRIEVSLPENHKRAYLSSHITQSLSLKKVVVLDSCADKDKNDEHFAQHAAPYIQKALQEAKIAGVGWGKTVWHISQQLQECFDRRERIFVSLIGMASTDNPCLQTNSILERIAGKYQSHTHFNNFKNLLFLQQMTTLDQKRWSKLLDTWEKMDTAIIGLGNQHHTLAQYSIEFENEPQMVEELETMIGDVLGNFFDESGKIYEFPSGAHSSSPKLSTLRDIPNVICVAHGIQKSNSIICAAKLGYFSTLITDEVTAESIWQTLQSNFDNIDIDTR